LSVPAQPRLQPPEQLVALINAYRSGSQSCAGRTFEPVGPLAPDAALASLPLAPGADLQTLLKRAGYSAERAQAIALSGPRGAVAAMQLLRTKYCEPLMNAHFAHIGVAREGASWRIVLAQPLFSADLGDSRAAGRQILDLTNAARAEPRVCGERHFAAAPPLAWDARLAAAAAAHSASMAKGNYFAHTGKSGERVGARAERAGYAWQAIGENIATGQGAPARAMDGWLASPTHCANIMNRDFTQMGAAYAVNPQADTAIYWTQVLGAPRR
jgi:uncharacterized protein YkwD